MTDVVAALLTLKAEVNNALKTEVQDFQNSKHEFTRENFVANTTALDRVFRVLSRFELIKGYEAFPFDEDFLNLLD